MPLKLLHESVGHIVTVELKTGVMYRGKLVEAEDTFNLQLRDVVCTQRDGRNVALDQVYCRGSQVRFVIVPDVLKNAPIFKVIIGKPSFAGRGRGRGGPRGGRGARGGGRGRG